MDTFRINIIWGEDGMGMMEMPKDMGLNLFLGEWRKRMGRDVAYN